MKTNLKTRLFCILLTALMVVGMLPLFILPAAAEDEEAPAIDYTKVVYSSPEERIAAMEKVADNGAYSLYCDAKLGVVAYRKNATGEILFTNPWDMGTSEALTYEEVRYELMSQIRLTYTSNQNSTQETVLTSFFDAALKDQISIKPIRNGVRVEYAIGEVSSRILLPRQIEASKFEALLKEFAENAGKGSWPYKQFSGYYRKYTSENEAHAAAFPVLKKKTMEIYVFDTSASEAQMREIEEYVKQYLPNYSFEEMDNDHDETEYVESSVTPPVFKLALEYTLNGDGLSVTLPANGLRYDESAYRITELKILPYMGASLRTNEGYSFIPDGSGTLYSLGTPIVDRAVRVYGKDFALYDFGKIAGRRGETMRMPVFGQVETDEATGISRGFFAVIEEGDTLASIEPSHSSEMQHAAVQASFITRQNDLSASNWKVYACRRYTGDYKLRYTILSDDTLAQNAGLTSYYECTWMGMACAYRDYLDAKDNGFERLTSDDVKDSIPLYIETFGCMDTIKKVMSMPVTVSVALTSFEDVAEMYDYLAGNGVTNVNFRLKGYANGGLYADTPYKLKWESAVGGKSGFKKLTKYAEEKDFGVYPDFDFVYTSRGRGGNDVRMKKDASRTIDNRYTTRRVYSATQQAMVSYYQMVLSPAMYSRFYEKLEKKYAKYKNASGISLGMLGNELNSDFDENKTVLREEAKTYVQETLAYFKDKNYNVMIEGGNAYTFALADHILGVPTDSSRYNSEYASIPFMGVVLHGYVEFTGSAFNMEGDLKYAMLKAMENGASAYFVLSAANTELLKEDELLSQNYSVRYDIWQSRLVDLYTELNAVLFDVQTKLIVGHEFLSESSRIPDADELLLDIADEARAQAQAIAEKIEQDRLDALRELRKAADTVADAKGSIDAAKKEVNNLIALMNGQRVAKIEVATSRYLYRAWQKCLDDLAAGVDVTNDAEKLAEQLQMYVINPHTNAQNYRTRAAETLTNAKAAYDYLVSVNADATLVADARNSLSNAITAYVDFIKAYRARTDLTLADTDRDAYIDTPDAAVETLNAAITAVGDDTVVADADLADFFRSDDAVRNAELDALYEGKLGVENLYGAYIRLLVIDGLYVEATPETSYINVPALEEKSRTTGSTGEAAPVEPPAEPETPTDVEEDEDAVIPDPPKSKYAVDNKVIAITYGDSAAAPFKTLLLNFNDYAVQTTYRGVAYSISGYGYAVVYY